jgi:hypothetical protein
MSAEEDDLWGRDFGDPDDPGEAADDAVSERRVLSWRQLPRPGDQQRWWQGLWQDVCSLRTRYRLAVRSRWWEDELQVEALAALAAWVGRYDSGDWEDPPGKLTLLFELERVETLLRDGTDPFNPGRDRPDFDRHLALLGLAEDPSW